MRDPDQPKDRGWHDKIVVTGLGVVSPAGVGVDKFWPTILKGMSHVRAASFFPDARVRSKAFGLADFDRETQSSWASKAGKDGDDRLFRIAATAIDEALSNAGIARDTEAGKQLLADAGLYISSAIGPIATMEALVHNGAGSNSQIKDCWRAFSFGRFAATLADRCGIGGPYTVLPTGCTGGCDAVGYGLFAIRSGAVDLAVVGGFDAPITPLVEAAFARINATSSRDCPAHEASCPFDIRRDGFVLGEGGGALVLERESHALARGVTPIAVIAGYGSVSSAYHMTDIHPSGEAIARSIASAVDDAGLNADEIDHFNLHGSSTPMNDLAEANALCATVGNKANTRPVTSLKSQIGHAMAAASAIELVAVMMTLSEQIIPPTANLTDQDPKIGLYVVSGQARRADLRTVLKTASGFSGIHSAVVAARYEA